MAQPQKHPLRALSKQEEQELHRIVKAKDSELEKLKEQNANLEKRLKVLEKLAEALEKRQLAGTQ